MQDKIGSAAGHIWKFLSTYKKPINISDLPKQSGLAAPLAYQGLGWLAREGKVDYQQKGRSIYVCLGTADCNC